MKLLARVLPLLSAWARAHISWDPWTNFTNFSDAGVLSGACGGSKCYFPVSTLASLKLVKFVHGSHEMCARAHADSSGSTFSSSMPNGLLTGNGLLKGLLCDKICCRMQVCNEQAGGEK